MTPENLKAILQQVVDENPFSIRAVLKVTAVEFTDEVPTLAVTREARPRLLVNLDFVTRHCKTDAEVEAVLCHEFLHVLLSHTESLEELTPELHLALDAVVNAIIHRELGPTRSAMMSRYYGRAKGLDRMLRPMNGREKARYQRDLRDPGSVQSWVHAWHALYEGKLVVDDIAEIARDLAKSGGPAGVSRDRLIGNHDDLERELPPALAQALDRAMREMNGSGIWRSPGRAAWARIPTMRSSPRQMPSSGDGRSRRFGCFGSTSSPTGHRGPGTTNRGKPGCQFSPPAIGAGSCARCRPRSFPSACTRRWRPSGQGRRRSISTCRAR